MKKSENIIDGQKQQNIATSDLKDEKSNNESLLTHEEIQQVSEILAKAKQRERKSIISSVKSLWKWMQGISILWGIVEKLRSLPWIKIQDLLQSILDAII
jgi:hypothetical protein